MERAGPGADGCDQLLDRSDIGLLESLSGHGLLAFAPTDHRVRHRHPVMLVATLHGLSGKMRVQGPFVAWRAIQTRPAVDDRDALGDNRNGSKSTAIARVDGQGFQVAVVDPDRVACGAVNRCQIQTAARS